MPCAVGNTWRTTELGLLLVVANTAVNYDDALTCCCNNGGHLVRVDSVGVKTLFDQELDGSNDQLWIGGRRFDSNVSGFVFSDGTPITVTFWEAGEPNEEASCIRRVREYWKDRDCQQQYGFVCQRS
ncbi:macrophage mannose receptor 1-like [Mya arenaria]|uniref:macrophage mannose receptor 1-like n=1 Tax=Mya arenaria TaxID=6604 RepID=UPI0022E48928|nr:macrophage mannose receptor 1-like [Mya arenaria]